MYEFRDTTAGPSQLPDLPTEAICVNGVWLDHELEAFRTLSVTGREMLEREFETANTDEIYGASVVSSRYSPRTITVTAEIFAKDAREFRETFNALGKILHSENLKLIFADEPDKYFTATRNGYSSSREGSNKSVIQMTFYCPDPRKYAVNEKEFTDEIVYDDNGKKTITIENRGALPVPIRYEIDMTTNNRLLEIESEIDGDTKKMAFGDAANTTEDLSSDTLLYLDKSSVSGEYNINNVSYRNNGSASSYGFPAALGDVYISGLTHATQTGDGIISILAAMFQNPQISGLDTITANKWNVAQITAPVGTPQKNFYTEIYHRFEHLENTRNSAYQSITFLDSSNNVICGYTMYMLADDDTGHFVVNIAGNVADISLASVDISEDTTIFDGSYGNRPFGTGYIGQIKFIKNNASVMVNIGNKWYTAYDNDGLMGEKKVAKVEIIIGECLTSVPSVQYQTVNNGIYAFYLYPLTSMNVSRRYLAGDRIIIDGYDGSFWVNRANRANNEIMGTEYFPSVPGTQDIDINMSYGHATANVKAIIREAWL